jgi:hypothetical protein
MTMRMRMMIIRVFLLVFVAVMKCGILSAGMMGFTECLPVQYCSRRACLLDLPTLRKVHTLCHVVHRKIV